MNWKTRFKLSAAFKPLNTLLRAWKRLQWRLTGSSLPPLHEIKQGHLITLRQRFAPRVFVETGTYRGKMIFAMRPYFDRVISIEVDPVLGQRAQQLFAGCPEVSVIIGDSAVALPGVLAELNEPALFWLDGHFSGGETGKGDKDTPILEELDAIFRHPLKTHVIAVDDALCFNGQDDYPSIAALERFVAERTQHYVVRAADNIIFITPTSR